MTKNDMKELVRCIYNTAQSIDVRALSKVVLELVSRLPADPPEEVKKCA